MTAAILLRPYLPADSLALADIFHASVEHLAADDYSAGQIDAWSSLADDLDAFARKLGEGLTLVALMHGAPAGFASLKGGDVIDLLYVKPECARMGVATTLVDALEKLAGARGAKKLTADVSDTAMALFSGRGFVAVKRNVLPLGGEWIANTTMSKALVADIEPQGTLQ